MKQIMRTPWQQMQNAGYAETGNTGNKAISPNPVKAPDLHILREWNIHRERILHTRVHLL